MQDRVEAEIAAGRIWRAKEILLSQVAQRPFSPELCERAGLVLLQTGDLFQAGRFLFLSGVRETGYEQAVELFVSRHRKAGWTALVGSFPLQAKRVPLSTLPDAVIQTLAELGFEGGRGRETLERAIVAQAKGGWSLRRVLGASGCLLVAAFLLASVIAGAPVVLRALAAWLR